MTKKYLTILIATLSLLTFACGSDDNGDDKDIYSSYFTPNYGGSYPDNNRGTNKKIIRTTISLNLDSDTKLVVDGKAINGSQLELELANIIALARLDSGDAEWGATKSLNGKYEGSCKTEDESTDGSTDGSTYRSTYGSTYGSAAPKSFRKDTSNIHFGIDIYFKENPGDYKPITCDFKVLDNTERFEIKATLESIAMINPTTGYLTTILASGMSTKVTTLSGHEPPSIGGIANVATTIAPGDNKAKVLSVLGQQYLEIITPLLWQWAPGKSSAICQNNLSKCSITFDTAGNVSAHSGILASKLNIPKW